MGVAVISTMMVSILQLSFGKSQYRLIRWCSRQSLVYIFEANAESPCGKSI